MSEPAVRCSAMPVFYVRMDGYHIPLANHLCLPACFPVIPFSAGNQQDLATGMFMPVVSCARFKRYIECRAVERAFNRDQHFKPGGPDEMIIRNFFPFREYYPSGYPFRCIHTTSSSAI